MDWDQIEGNWKQFKGRVKEEWDNLTDDHLDTIKGQRDQLAAKIQEAYGITKGEAEKQISKWEKKEKVYRSETYPPCIPVLPGSKPKQSRRHKLDRLLANTRVPSALGAWFFHLARRYLAGKEAANAQEERTFIRLRNWRRRLRRRLPTTSASMCSTTRVV